MNSPRYLVVLALLLLAALTPLLAAPPAWWSAPETAILTGPPAPVSENYAPANLGQLKHTATQAKRHLDRELAAIGGAGPEINALIASFTPAGGHTVASRAANYAPANLGQLKAVAKPFYDRLIAIGYNTRQNLVSHGAPGWAFTYPWNPATPKEQNYSPANIGQMKWAFSFDLTGRDFTEFDADGDGFTNFTEYWQGTNPGVFDPDTDADGIPDEWEALHDGQFAVWPPRISASLLLNRTTTKPVVLRNDTDAPVNYSIAVTDNFAPAASYSSKTLTGDAVPVWQDIRNDGVLLSAISEHDDASAAIPVAFSFPFYGQNFSTVHVSSNGFVTFGECSLAFNNEPLGMGNDPANLVAAFWDDLDTTGTGEVHYKQESDHLIIQYQDVGKVDGNGTYTFQIILFNDGRIEFRYHSLEGIIDQCTVGIQDETRLEGVQMVFNSGYLTSNMAVAISPVAKFFDTSPIVGVVAPHSSVSLAGVFSSDVSFGNHSANISISHNSTGANPKSVVAELNVLRDLDGNGMPDVWEITHALNPLEDDKDGDGLSDLLEYTIGSDPSKADSNGDGIPDLIAHLLGLSLTYGDPDRDGWSAATEMTNGTNPHSADTDGDGIPDHLDYFPLDPSRSNPPVTDPGDNTAPIITLLEPLGALPIP